jgi:hypothetical protein
MGDDRRNETAGRDWMGLLDRELYWRSEATADLALGTEDLRLRLERLAGKLQEDLRRGVPVFEPSLREGRGWRRALKRALFRGLRPMTRRNDRVSAELASMAAELVSRLSQTQSALQRLDAEIATLRRRLDGGGAGPAEASPARGPSRWSFEPPADERARTLRRYEGLAGDLRSRLGDPAPLWIDLGCGRGELLGLLGPWGFRGASAIEADPVRYLLGYEEEPPAVITALGLLEHLPVNQWSDLFRGAQRVLRQGGGMLLETIDASRPEGMAAAFADPSVTRPATRETVRRLARDAGFADVVDVELGEPERFAVYARV